MRTSLILRCGVLSASLFGFCDAQAASAPVRVTVWAQHHCSGNVSYRYQVTNNGTGEIRRLLIGLYQPDDGDGGADLSALPAMNGKNFWLSSSVAGSPAGWNVKIYYPEESQKFSLEWIGSSYFKSLWPGASVAQDGPPASSVTPVVLGPGSFNDNFWVWVNQVDQGYVEGRANLDYDSISVNVPIEKGDTIAPTLNVTSSQGTIASGYGGTAAVFNIQASASDNYDPEPDLALAPITSNQALAAADAQIVRTSGGWKVTLKNAPGRTYQMRIVATDATGNATQKVIDYAVKTSVKNAPNYR